MRLKFACGCLVVLVAVLILFFASISTDTIEIVQVGEPTYPQLARQSRIQGDVRLKVLIARDGTVSDAEVFDHMPNGLLCEDTIKNIRGWQFNPGRNRTLDITYSYRLAPPEIDDRGPLTVTVDFDARRITIQGNFAKSHAD